MEPKQIKLKKNQFFYIISYPRSGNTWLVNSLKDYLGAQRAEVGESVYAGDRLRVNQSMYLSMAREYRPDLPIGIKTHMVPSEFLDAGCIPSKIIYLLRDPRDVMISYYFYQKGFIEGNEKKARNFDQEDFSVFLRDNLADYKAHLEDWRNSGHEIRVVRYEEMKNAYEAVLESIRSYLQLPVRMPTYEVKAKYVDNFKSVDGFMDVLKGNNMDFYRKGIIGDWKNYFDKNHVSIVKGVVGDLMSKLEYE